MQNALFDPTALLDEGQRTWLAATMERNQSRFAGWAMEDDDADDKDKDDDADKGDDDQDDKSKDADKDDDAAEDWKAKFEAQQRVNRGLERKGRKDLARIKELEGAKPADKGGKKDKGDDDAPDPEKIREEAKAEARREALSDKVADKIEAKASKFADPEDAVAVLLRSREIDDFIDDDKVDVEAITDALKELGEKKPHLLAQGSRFKGGADGGRRKGKDSGRPKDLGDAISRHYESGS